MIPEVEFVLETLDSVVSNQPADHPLHRVDRDNSRIYEDNTALDQTQPISKRKKKLEAANLVGIASQTASNAPYGTDYDHERDMVLSARVEGLTHFEHGHIDPDGSNGVVWDSLCEEIKSGVLDERTYPSHASFRTAQLDLGITNESYNSKDWADYYQREFDIVFRGRKEL